MSKVNLIPSPLGGRWWGALRHAFSLIREDKLFSAIYIAGTAVAIASAMVVAIVFNMLLADIPPESHRSRTLYPFSYFVQGENPHGPFHQGHSPVAIDSCFRQMRCVEAATGVMPAYHYRFPVSDDQRSVTISASTMVCDHDFFRIYDLNFISGRAFSEAEFRSGERVCVITDKVQEKVGDEATLVINDLPFRVVGVVKAVSAFLRDATADVYLPYTIEGFGIHPTSRREGDVWSDASYSGNLDARILLRKGYSRQDFLDELEPLRQQYNAFSSAAVGERLEWVMTVNSHFFRTINFFASDDETLGEQAMNLMPPALLMLLFLLLPAINLSGLVSNRMEARRAEMGIRKAFGAKRRTLLRETIRENLVLTLLGGILGWGLSALFIAAIRNNQIFLEMFISRDQNAADTSLALQMFFTPTLFLIVFLCCVVLNLMAALIPAWRALKSPIVESLNQKQ